MTNEKPVNVDLLVMAAGMGSRFGGIKQLEPVGPAGELLLDYAVFDALRAGIDRVIFVVRSAILADFQALVGARYADKIAVHYVLQEIDDLPSGWRGLTSRQKPWGTGHAVWCARQHLSRPFLAINADDYYGAHAFAPLVASLQGDAALWPTTHAMMAYDLGQTLSDFGAVSRGVCTLDNQGLLQRVDELTKIQRRDGAIVSETGSSVVLQPTTPVSLNCWGFRPSFLEALDRLLHEFLAQHATSPSAEFYLPQAVDALLARHEIAVQVLRSTDAWFGLTYLEDKAAARARIADLVANAVYPAPLWHASHERSDAELRR